MLLRERIEPTNGHPHSKTIGFYLCSWSEQSRVGCPFVLDVPNNERMFMKATKSYKTSKAPRNVFIIFLVIIGLILVLVVFEAVSLNLEHQKAATQAQKAADDKATQDKAIDAKKQQDAYFACLTNAIKAETDALGKVSQDLDATVYIQQGQLIQSFADAQKQDCDRLYGKD